MKVVDARRQPVTTSFKRTNEIPNGFFLDSDGALWFKDQYGAVLINARGTANKMLRVDTAGIYATWHNPQPVHGVIRIERNA